MIIIKTKKYIKYCVFILLLQDLLYKELLLSYFINTLNIKSFLHRCKKFLINKNNSFNCKRNIISQVKLNNDFFDKLGLNFNQIIYIVFLIPSFPSEGKQISNLFRSNLEYLNVFLQILTIKIIRIESNLKKIIIKNNDIYDYNHKNFIIFRLPIVQNDYQVIKKSAKAVNNFKFNNSIECKKKLKFYPLKIQNIKKESLSIKRNKNNKNIIEEAHLFQKMLKLKKVISTLGIKGCCFKKIYTVRHQNKTKIEPDICQACPALQKFYQYPNIVKKIHANTQIKPLITESLLKFTIAMCEKKVIIIQENSKKILLNKIDFIKFISSFFKAINISEEQELLKIIETSKGNIMFTLHYIE